MADALCGPSNALQQFQKHSSVDRTLQQDRLVGRHSPALGFRSSPVPANGAIDSEFEAFQAGHTGLLQPDFHHAHSPQQLARPPPHFAHANIQAPQGPDWASDFQRLNLSSAHTPPIHQQQQRVPAPSAAASWHQDFITQQAPVSQAPQFQQQNGLGGMGMAGYGRSSAYMGMNGGMGMNMASQSQSHVAQGKQRAQESLPLFDEAAFEQAFAEVDQAMLEEAEAGKQRQRRMDSERHTEEQDRIMGRYSSSEGQQASEAKNEDHALQRLQEQRPAVYAALKIRRAIDLGKPLDAGMYFDSLESLEESSMLTADASEARWVVDALQKISNRAGPEEQDTKTRADTVARAINERLMSTYPLLSTRTQMTSNMSHIWEELEAAGYTRSPMPEQLPQQPEQTQQEADQELPQLHGNDEMAETAGKLLERVADNTSEKFQNSQFLELMRKLRDREVRVEGDKMIEVSDLLPTSTSTSAPTIAPQQTQHHIQHINREDRALFLTPSSPTRIPDIDPNILNYADTEFGLPGAEDDLDQFDYPPHQEYATSPLSLSLSRQSTSEPLTDEISDQFSYYNVNAAYHK